jgi:hypothetical protein
MRSRGWMISKFCERPMSGTVVPETTADAVISDA